MERLTFIIKDKEKEVTCEVIATYHDDVTNKDFIVYTDKTINEDGKLNLYYSLYKMIDNSIKLIETKEIEDKKIGLELVQEIIKMLK